MVRGVFLEINSNNILQHILTCIDVEKYCWYNIQSQNEVWLNHSGGISLNNDYYDGNSFLKQINSEHYVIFLKLQAYFKNGNFYNIHTYEDFLRSDCQLLLLINDCYYVEIYAKNQVVIKTIYENALTNNYTEVEYINDSNDSRTKMDVL